jgi:sarcosine oxidase
MNSPGRKHFDAIVLGVGSMGSAACFYLAKKGLSVLGLEQFDIPNEYGSHGGQSRIIRKAYFEHPDYVPLMIRAYENWKELESITGSRVYYDTGLLYAGKKDQVLMKGVRESAAKYSIRVDEISAAETKNQFPQFAIPEDYDILFEPDAGFLLPAKCISLFSQEAKKAWRRYQGSPKSKFME